MILRLTLVSNPDGDVFWCDTVGQYMDALADIGAWQTSWSTLLRRSEPLEPASASSCSGADLTSFTYALLVTLMHSGAITFWLIRIPFVNR
ncbi:unnamed protein product [Protopolystoma xenopodis]|uniref:Uncharacterized protein n=1 Tax=Protopolystoma xenopodis TaxID=117903 RepID=A0A3S5AYB4_9PLAT|nr:unnamed protein product [Protopolystoma xenopodis]